ncbi:protein RICE SALT SENSITIVE 3-like [Solanum verrucosum]|uniref:protein RICE SALT SENSITIVE 3-like n=1 Tax=Solanum verrucosum TaxID=315347 RepID=UPI0020D093CC|nr:protein RICE SALT SENSITIVE 3-like [Solanum verrucosum]
MEGGLPMLNCLLQHTLRSLCTCSDSSSNASEWVYAVFWRIIPRNYPPPKWDHGGGLLDRAKGNKRNWILVWEDGFCDFYECERSKREYVTINFGPEIFFKMSHEVYSFGEGLVGKVAADNSHRWVFKDAPNEKDSNFICSWNMSIEAQPRAWGVQFNSGIQTIAIISVREGIIQLGSFNKVFEDHNLVLSIQRKFSYLQSIPGIYAIQRPFLPIKHPYTYKPNNVTLVNETDYQMDDKNQLIGSKRVHEFPFKSINFGYNSPQTMASLPLWSMPIAAPSCYGNAVHEMSSLHDRVTRNTTSKDVKVIDELGHFKFETAEENDQFSLNQNLGLENKVVEVGFRQLGKGGAAPNPN